MDWGLLLGTGRRRIIQSFSSYIHLRSAASTIAASFPSVALAIIPKSDRSSDDRGLFNTGWITHLQFAFHGDGETTIKDSKDFFDVAIKLYGLYLVAGAIPSCIWLIANVLIVLRAPPYLSVDDELEGIQSYLLPVLTTLGLGTCCLILSSRLTGLAFHRAESSAP